MTDIASMITEAKEGGGQQSYLGNGSHEVRIQKAEIKTGDDAYPTWATKSLAIQFGNDDGVRFADYELEPLTGADGQPNTIGQKILIQNLTGLGVNLDGATTIGDIVSAAVSFIVDGSAQGALVAINVNDKPSTRMNPKTNKPYLHRNTYINEVLEAGVGSSSLDAVKEAFDAEELTAF